MMLALSFVAMSAAQEPSLGDVARKQRTTPKPHARRVIDNENLPHASAADAMNGAVVGGTPAEAEHASSSASAKPDVKKALEELSGAEQADKDAIAKLEEQLRDGNLNSENRQMLQEGLDRAKKLLAHYAEERRRLAEQSDATAGKDESAPEVRAERAQPKRDEKAEPAKREAGEKSGE
jgi:hypothetical protein